MNKSAKRAQMLSVASVASLLLGLFLACSHKTPTRSTNAGPATVALQVNLEQSSQLDPIAYLVLTVSASDMDTIRRQVSIQNGSFEVTLSVPAGASEKLFTLEAKNAVDKTLYRGSASGRVEPGRTLELDINLAPAVMMIKITPRHLDVGLNSEFACSVEVHEVTSLFGISFRIEYDQNALEYLDAQIGHPCLLGPSDSVIFFDTSGTGYLAVSITRMFPATTVSGSGPLARLAFRAISLGTTKLTFDPATLSLIDNVGNDIPDFDSLIIDEGTIEIDQESRARSNSRLPLFLDMKTSNSINRWPSSRGVAIETLENARRR